LACLSLWSCGDRHRQHVRRRPVGRGGDADRNDRHARLGGIRCGQQRVVRTVWRLGADITGKGIVNPLAMILSAAMMLHYSLDRPEQAARVENAVKKVLKSGLRTGDIWEPGRQRVGTREMGDAVLKAL